jgi:hypothetical protein
MGVICFGKMDAKTELFYILLNFLVIIEMWVGRTRKWTFNLIALGW